MKPDLHTLQKAMLKHFEDDKDSFGGIQKSLDELNKGIMELKTSFQPMEEWFSHYNFGKKFVWSIMGFVGAVVALLIGLKQLLSKA